jgi:hypothetical protein
MVKEKNKLDLEKKNVDTREEKGRVGDGTNKRDIGEEMR